MWNRSEWTIETLRLHLLALLESQDRRYQERAEAQEKAVSSALASAGKATDAAFAAAKEATSKADEAASARFESHNRFREQLTEQARTFIPRAEAEVLLKGHSDRLSAIEARQNQAEGSKGGTAQGWGFAVGALGFVAAAIAIASRFWR